MPFLFWRPRGCNALSFKESNARASGQPQIHPFRNGFSNSFKPL
ncbi:hypothetical protein SAMN04487926_10624 [Paraburkholderia steynii]|uniref:Uncharacterized protein n=1 Tax=Paraburkholderia steynii TaxID=1245441 RepID=A0A7Z7B4N0_9BURK|nr:hypothetical protein SAMN04487926_10624 [Paraburkholderia steynii]